MPTPPTLPNSDPEQSRTRRASRHVQRNAGKYTALTMITTITPVILVLLQLVGALGPMLCVMPWVDDQKACLQVIAASKQAARELGQLDGMTLDAPATISPEPAPVPTHEVSND